MYQIMRGGLARRVIGQQARQKITRELHGVVLASTAEVGRVPANHAEWFYDLRRGRRHIYGSLLRFIDVSITHGASKDVLLMIPRWIESYICDQYDARESVIRGAA